MSRSDDTQPNSQRDSIEASSLLAASAQWSVCPIDCIKKDPEHNETLDELAEKFIRLTSS